MSMLSELLSTINTGSIKLSYTETKMYIFFLGLVLFVVDANAAI